MGELLDLTRRISLRLQRREGRCREGERPPRYSDWLLIRLWIVCAVEGWSLSTFYARLPGNALWLRLKWGLPNALPSRGVAYDRMSRKRFLTRLRTFFEEASREAIRFSGEEETSLLALDLTALVAPYSDAGAAAGHSSAKWCFWGYKLGLVVTRSGVPIAYRLMKARWTEGTSSLPLIQEGKQRLRETGRLDTLQYLTVDKGYDAEKNYRETTRGCRAMMVCPGKKTQYKRRVKHPDARRRNALRHPHRMRALKFSRSWEGELVYRGRTIVEQINSQLKGAQFGIDHFPPHVRGLRKVELWCLRKLIHFVLCLCANRAQGRLDRSVRAYAS